MPLEAGQAQATPPLPAAQSSTTLSPELSHACRPPSTAWRKPSVIRFGVALGCCISLVVLIPALVLRAASVASAFYGKSRAAMNCTLLSRFARACHLARL
jgi:hypothetical protein